MMYSHEQDDDDDNKHEDSDLQQYFSNGDDQTKKPTAENAASWFETDDHDEVNNSEPLSINDLVVKAEAIIAVE